MARFRGQTGARSAIHRACGPRPRRAQRGSSPAASSRTRSARSRFARECARPRSCRRWHELPRRPHAHGRSPAPAAGRPELRGRGQHERLHLGPVAGPGGREVRRGRAILSGLGSAGQRYRAARAVLTPQRQQSSRRLLADPHSIGRDALVLHLLQRFCVLDFEVGLARRQQLDQRRVRGGGDRGFRQRARGRGDALAVGLVTVIDRIERVVDRCMHDREHARLGQRVGLLGSGGVGHHAIPAATSPARASGASNSMEKRNAITWRFIGGSSRFSAWRLAAAISAGFQSGNALFLSRILGA